MAHRWRRGPDRSRHRALDGAALARAAHRRCLAALPLRGAHERARGRAHPRRRSRRRAHATDPGPAPRARRTRDVLSHLQPRGRQRGTGAGDGSRGARARKSSHPRRGEHPVVARDVRRRDAGRRRRARCLRHGALAATRVRLLRRRDARHDRARGLSLRFGLGLSLRPAHTVGAVRRGVRAGERTSGSRDRAARGRRGRRTIEVLRRVLPALRTQGYRVVTLSDLAAPQR